MIVKQNNRCMANASNTPEVKNYSYSCPAWESSTPTCHAPSAFVEEVGDDQEDYIPGDDGPGDDGPGDDGPGDDGPGDDGPDGNDPNGDNPGDDNPEPHDDDDDDDDEGEPINGLPGQDDTGIIIFNNLSIAIDRLAYSV
ncbi:hypothetical protein SCLCIDRAFT_21217 [Scleroderma citrinum Foug A]|uniref:Uncharacterized protein n=1 Tax=Scleroderma citrinum Foug A TaxID=1036808 RepID=A0A0C3E3G3_9AGAM|nr:hypothetical protein SCLCIDRAFT_21217 [Scleroderma citrinum Foug A]